VRVRVELDVDLAYASCAHSRLSEIFRIKIVSVWVTRRTRRETRHYDDDYEEKFEPKPTLPLRVIESNIHGDAFRTNTEGLRPTH
jgi:hypothetical protein